MEETVAIAGAGYRLLACPSPTDHWRHGRRLPLLLMMKMLMSVYCCTHHSDELINTKIVLDLDHFETCLTTSQHKSELKDKNANGKTENRILLILLIFLLFTKQSKMLYTLQN